MGSRGSSRKTIRRPLVPSCSPTAFRPIPSDSLPLPSRFRSDRLARGAPLPHVLIHGSPGVGKTLLSRKLGRMCGLRSAIISGGDVGSFGRSASAEMNRLMQWAGASQSLSWKRGYRRGRRRRAPGVMLVLNEAEAVVGDRRFVKYCEACLSPSGFVCDKEALTAVLTSGEFVGG